MANSEYLTKKEAEDAFLTYTCGFTEGNSGHRVRLQAPVLREYQGDFGSKRDIVSFLLGKVDPQERESVERGFALFEIALLSGSNGADDNR